MAKTKNTTDEKSGSFLTAFNEDCSKMKGIAMSAPPPKVWLDSGSYIINKVISGSYTRGYAGGRIAGIAGPSGSGKSFLAGNAVKSALNNTETEWGAMVIDAEHAIDDDYLGNIGANIDNPFYVYRGVTTIPECLNIVSKFIAGYKKTNEDMPFLIAIDSLDMLQTENENIQYQKGEIGGDQGQHAKQIKAMLKRFVNDLRGTNIVMICTKQAYQEQDKIAAYTNPWRVTEAAKFAFSQLLMVTRLMMKDDTTKIFEGIELKVRGDKTRFTKPFQQCKIEVPYDIGMDPYTGILQAAETLGVVVKNGSWYNFGEEKFQKGSFDELKELIFAKVLERETEALNVLIEEEEDTSDVLNGKEIQLKRKTRQTGAVKEEDADTAEETE